MSTANPVPGRPTLAERQSELTERVILESALRLLEQGSVGELTVRAVAKQAGISERTVFRYFATREDFLHAVAGAVRTSLDLPGPPASVEDLLAMPRQLFQRFEAKRNLTLAALHTELFDRMRETQARLRWAAVRKVVDGCAPKRPDRERRIAAANIRYYLSATTWHYFRFYFEFSLEDTVACAEAAIRQSLDGLRRR